MPDSRTGSAEISVRVGGGTPQAYPRGVSAGTVLLRSRLLVERDTLAAMYNGKLVDLEAPLDRDGELEAVSVSSTEGLETLRHSTSHIMACAVKGLFPDVRVAIGPAIENGYYYDFDLPSSFTPDHLAQIEKRMEEIVAGDVPFVRKVISKEEAVRIFREKGEKYKLEILEDIADQDVSIYTVEGFTDLCRGPHVPSSGWTKVFKLTGVAGAYWKGDERNPMLQRIYGTAFPTREALAQHLLLLEEARKRDHRKLGRELDLFTMTDEIGPGLVCWHPRGAKVRLIIENFWREEHMRKGYDILYTPHMARIQLWKTSGHTEFYRENMFSPMEVEGQEYLIKPMNCPFHIQIFKSRLNSYRDLPKRWAELGTVYRYERSGVLHGLLRVRGFTQDDAHIFCRPDQLEEEILGVIELTLFVLKTFGFEKFDTFLSTRPEKYVGSLDHWELATNALMAALKRTGLEYEVDPGEGVFYGPKIDIKIRDSLGRQWQCSTIQVDFNLPERFELEFVGEDGLRHPVIMIHRALMGSLERFFGCLVEHYNGAFPVWLAPEQAVVLPITDRNHPYAEQIHRTLVEHGIRAELDRRNEKLGLKIREAQLRKVPYMVVLGDKESQSETISVRDRSGSTHPPMRPEAFVEKVLQETRNRLV